MTIPIPHTTTPRHLPRDTWAGDCVNCLTDLIVETALSTLTSTGGSTATEEQQRGTVPWTMFDIK